MIESQLLHLSAIENAGSLQIAISYGVKTTDGEECTRRAVMQFDAVSEAHCSMCWLDDVLGTVMGEQDKVEWRYTHGGTCSCSGDENDHA